MFLIFFLFFTPTTCLEFDELPVDIKVLIFEFVKVLQGMIIPMPSRLSRGWHDFFYGM